MFLSGWGYSVLACSIVVLVSCIGVFFGPCLNTPGFNKILVFCVALAVSTLACTGLMVLIPEVNIGHIFLSYN